MRFQSWLAYVVISFIMYLRHDHGDGHYAEHAMVEDLLLAKQRERAGICRTHRYHSAVRPELKYDISEVAASAFTHQ